MANLPESQTFDAGVYQIEILDPVVGGVDGIANAPSKNLANRTAYLKKHVDDIESGATIPPTVAPLASPLFTGDPRGPTAAPQDNDTSLATTAFVQRNSAGVLAKDVAGSANVTLTAEEAGYPVFELTGVLTGNIQVIVPTDMTDRWIVDNDTSGAFTVTVKAATGAGVVIPQGKAVEVVWDGTNVFAVGMVTSVAGRTGDVTLGVADVSGAAPLESPALTGTPTVPTAAAGTNNTQAASTEFAARASADAGLVFAIALGG